MSIGDILNEFLRQENSLFKTHYPLKIRPYFDLKESQNFYLGKSAFSAPFPKPSNFICDSID